MASYAMPEDEWRAILTKYGWRRIESEDEDHGDGELEEIWVDPNGTHTQVPVFVDEDGVKRLADFMLNKLVGFNPVSGH